MENRPRGRKKNYSNGTAGVHKRGDGLGSSGPVGRQDGYSGRKKRPASYQQPVSQNEFQNGEQQQTGSSHSRGLFGSGSGKLILIVIAALVLFGGGSGLGNLLGLFGGGSSSSSGGLLSSLLGGGSSSSSVSSQQSSGSSLGSLLGGGLGSSLFSGNMDISSLLGGGASTTPAAGWTRAANTGKLDTTVAAGSREKYTKLKGNGNDTVTIMVYMCGTDLESQGGMGSADLQEMLDATVSDKINLLIFTGGCKQWKNNVVSSKVNQIYKVEKGANGKNGLNPLVSDAGTSPMTDPKNLKSYIQFCMKNYPASRYGLILWDHGGGSLTGYGYDEKNQRSGSMTLKGINDALTSYKKTFDFIGFDACLMGTLETGLMLAPYADYLIASEETEPGIGWYYKTWLTKLSENTSISTLELGKSVVDSFIKDCETRCRGQKATLSVIDLAELSNTAPDKLKDWAKETSETLKSDGYQTVSDARSSTREFAADNKIDQIDLVDFATHLNTSEAKELADTLLGAVKYNNTSSAISNAYGVSIYFPYRKSSGVSSAVATYDAIGMEDEYTDVIREFAGIQYGGQAASTGSGSPLSSLLGGGSASSGMMGSDAISSLLSGMMGGGNSLFGRTLDVNKTAEYIAENQFDASQLEWKSIGGIRQIKLSEEQWSLVHDLAINVFYDDGEGFIDLGIDNTFELSDEGALLGVYDGTWLAIDGNVIAYYYVDTVEDGENYTITGRVPVLLNGTRAELMLVFNNEHEYGFIAGARTVYTEGETETIAKGMTELKDGDKIDFLCDYYTYDGDYQDTYYLGEQYTWHGQPEISNIGIDKDAAQVTYLFTDIYCNEYWTSVLPQ